MSLTTYERLAESPSIQLAVADAAASLIDTAQLRAYRAADDLDRAAAEVRRLTVAERARVRMDTAGAATRSRGAVGRLVSVSGASAAWPTLSSGSGATRVPLRAMASSTPTSAGRSTVVASWASPTSPRSSSDRRGKARD
ncbi:acyl-CoA dehydrogenase family protein [Streptomyces mirabilis]|uniref:hypothetical protein n=1 Tax=Streptomyces mirabilis TaxID=68239 RepID=UPI0036EF2EB7